MKRLTKWTAVLVALSMFLVLPLSGCKSSTANKKASQVVSTASTKDKIDTSKAVKLTGLMISANGTQSPDQDLVIGEVNKILQKEINATVEIRITSQQESKTKLPLLLASGEDLDFVNSNAVYSSEAVKGAFVELTEEMIKKYMPLSYAVQDKRAYEVLKVNGKLYAITRNLATAEGLMHGLMIRSDLRKKYGLPEVKKISDLETFMDAVLKNEKGMIPFNLGKDDAYVPMTSMLMEQKGIMYYLGAWPYLNYNFGTQFWGADNNTIYDFMQEPLKSLWVENLKKIKTWYDKGYITKSPFANTLRTMDSFRAEKSAVAWGNSTEFFNEKEKFSSSGKDIEFMQWTSQKGKIKGVAPGSSIVSIPRNSKNPERTLMALDYLAEDPKVSVLSFYGIEGKHYEKMAGGKFKAPNSVDPKNPIFGQSAPYEFNWLRDKKVMDDTVGQWHLKTPERIAFEEYVAKSGVQHPYGYFTAQLDSLKTEAANITNVRTTIGNAQMLGIFETGNVDTDFEIYIKKLKDAGVDKINTEILKQLDEHMKTFK